MNSTPSVQPQLNALKKALSAQKIDLWLQPMHDEFQSEYVPESAARLPWLTGFTGSAGLGVFREAQGNHVLFVDGRYTLQAAQQVNSGLFDVLNSGDVSLGDWLKDQGKVRVGFDPWIITERQLQAWKKATEALEVEWVAVSPNPVDAIWKERPAFPAGEVVLHGLEYAGTSYPQKRDALIAQMKDKGADALVLTLPDSINWLLNIRGSDIDFNPLLLSYFILKKDGSAALYSYEHAFSDEVVAYFKEHKVETGNIADIFDYGKVAISAKAKLWIDPAEAAHGWWALAQKNNWQIIAAEDPTQLPKAIKNEVELDGIRRAHARDGLALSNFLGWFDGQVVGGRLPDELTVVRVLEEHRARDNSYRGPSFATIAGVGPNGAIVHYRAEEHTNRRARMGDLFLLDSGGQYQDGTTDVTRTMAVGNASPFMKEHFTRVLKGHIALATVRFPEGTNGAQLDALARQYLWQAGLDYDHGTGHGVGAYLCVHEGPQRISKRGQGAALVPGMILSNEPGYYAEGQYGIRIENLVVVIEVGKTATGKKLLGFETLTLAPIDTRLVDVSMLSSEERNWLNAYHQRVYKTHEAAMDDRSRRWLAGATRAI